MPVKRSTVLRWTGRGSLSLLKASVYYVLHAHRVRGRVSTVGGSIVVIGPEPLGVAALLQHMPGIAWIGTGFAGASNDLTKSSSSLAGLYLRRGDRFSVEAEGTEGVLASDIGGAVTSRILEAAKGARVSDSPRVKFHAAADGARGVVVVEVRTGAGGVPTGREEVSCLVSGGMHSSVAAWMSVLAGFRVRLVHAKVNEESLRAVARLYSELSNRADPRGLELEVLEGGVVQGMLVEYATRSQRRVYGGFHAAAVAPPKRLERAVASPVYLMPEERFRAEFGSLGFKPFDSMVRWGQRGASKFTSKSFVGGPADVSTVLDGLS